MRNPALRAFAAAAGLTVLVAAGRTAVQSSSVPMAPHGDTIGGSAGQVVPLTSTSLLPISAGADGNWSNGDDGLILVTNIGSSNDVRGLLTGPINDQDGFVPAVLDSDTVVLQTLGADGNSRSGDETVALLTN